MGNKSSRKVLVAFDFDHTVLDCNSDVEIQDMAEDGNIPMEIRVIHEERGFADFMQAVFTLLFEQGRTRADYVRRLIRLPFAPGMEDLWRKLAEKKDKFEIIVVSDANTFFIETILEEKGLQTAAEQVYSNPAKFEESGELKIEHFHRQDWCELSSKNLCKGTIVQDHVKKRAKGGVKFSHIVYVGDGKNDLCPAVRLKANDLIFARKNFTLAKILASSEKKIRLNAQLKTYENGAEIAEFLQI